MRADGRIDGRIDIRGVSKKFSEWYQKTKKKQKIETN
jgi:hypothetical protein